MNYSTTNTITYSEKGCVKLHSKEMSSYGTKAIIVTGKNSAKKCGALDDVIWALQTNNTAFCIFDKIEENPSVETVMEAADFANNEGADFVIGIGGGSPLDASKSISIMMKCFNKGTDFLFEQGEYDAYPVICIPTTCGTGSEVTGVSVLTRHDLKTKVSMKKKLFPVLSLLDWSYLQSLSPFILTSTSIDAMGHMIESFINKNATKDSRNKAREGLKVWSSIKDFLGDQTPENPPTGFYLNLMLSSNLGGYSIVTPGTNLPHALSYKLTYNYHVPHGIAVGIFEPCFMAMAAENEREELLTLMGFDSFMQFCDFITEKCFKPLYERYLSREQLKTVIDESLKDFLNEKSRVAKLTFEISPEIFTANFKY